VLQSIHIDLHKQRSVSFCHSVDRLQTRARVLQQNPQHVATSSL